MRITEKDQSRPSLANGVRAKKHLGQHFLTDQNIARKIVDALKCESAEAPCAVLEIGCGTGVLTTILLQRSDLLLYGAEVDNESVEYLKREFPFFAPRLYHADFLTMTLREQFSGCNSLRIIGNFPYNISSQIFFKILDSRDFIPQVVGMVQKEVAERIAERPGTKTYGILSVLLQAWYDIEYLFTVGEKVFNPPPKVKSAVIRLTRNERKKMPCDEVFFTRVVKTCFGQRRKMLRNTLRAFGELPGQHPFLDKRPEQLSVEDFIELTCWLSNNNSSQQ